MARYTYRFIHGELMESFYESIRTEQEWNKFFEMEGIKYETKVKPLGGHVEVEENTHGVVFVIHKLCDESKDFIRSLVKSELLEVIMYRYYFTLETSKNRMCYACESWKEFLKEENIPFVEKIADVGGKLIIDEILSPVTGARSVVLTIEAFSRVSRDIVKYMHFKENCGRGYPL